MQKTFKVNNKDLEYFTEFEDLKVEAPSCIFKLADLRAVTCDIGWKGDKSIYFGPFTTRHYAWKYQIQDVRELKDCRVFQDKQGNFYLFNNKKVFKCICD